MLIQILNWTYWVVSLVCRAYWAVSLVLNKSLDATFVLWSFADILAWMHMYIHTCYLYINSCRHSYMPSLSSQIYLYLQVFWTFSINVTISLFHFLKNGSVKWGSWGSFIKGITILDGSRGNSFMHCLFLAVVIIVFG